MERRARFSCASVTWTCAAERMTLLQHVALSDPAMVWPFPLHLIITTFFPAYRGTEPMATLVLTYHLH